MFATNTCNKHCYALLKKWPDFDEQIRIPERKKREIMNAMISFPISKIRDILLFDLDGLQTNILHWFGSGDCPTASLDRVTAIIKAMDGDCTQMGFTRNEKLWDKRKDIFALTVESKDEIKGRNGLFAVADYERGTSIMYRNGKQTRGGYCGPEICNDEREKRLAHFINCQTCKRLNLGCFDRYSIIHKGIQK